MEKLVIIGGGFAGTTVARKLGNHFNVTLIDAEDYFEFTPGILRTLVEPNHYKKIQVLHKDYLKKSKVVIGEVNEVGKDYVLIKGKNNKIKFDFLVIASGSSYNEPIKEENVYHISRVKHLQESNKALKKAKSICIVGGGLVGVELMSEICTHYKDKRLILIHAHNKLIERNNKKSSKYAENFLKKHNVELIFNERVKSRKKNVLITENGLKIKSDLTFFTTGITPNYKFMEKNYSHKIRKGLIINNNLQLWGVQNIFVAGDVTGIKEEKTAQNAKKHAKIVIQNLIALKSKRKLKEYKSKRRLMVISLGKYDGIIEYKGFIFTGIFPAFLKYAIEKIIILEYHPLFAYASA